MSRGVLLDSSAVIAHLRGKLDIADFLPATDPWFLPLVALGELYKGVLKSSKPTQNREALEIFLKTVAVIHPDAATAHYYADISVKLESKGCPIPENDIWIAAVAIECGLPLMTLDAHFSKVEGLSIVTPKG